MATIVLTLVALVAGITGGVWLAYDHDGGTVLSGESADSQTPGDGSGAGTDDGSSDQIPDQYPDAPSAAGKPNVILFVADDLDKKLMRFMPNVRRYIASPGASFSDYYVEQSTCCTSRATMLSGQYTHNHGVRGNHAPAGGFLAWKGRSEDRALPTWLGANGYRSALLGKYLNEYPFPAGYSTKAKRTELRRYVPPGWASWQSPVNGTPYEQFDYVLNTNGTVDGTKRSEFLDSEMGRRTDALLSGLDDMDFREGGKFVYYASYSPHKPYAYPASYASRFRNVRYPHTPGFNERDISDKFGITGIRKPLSPARIAHVDSLFRKRVRSVQVLDQNVKNVVEELKAQGTLDNTYLMFTSDNGYNLGEHRLYIAKYNQFQETVNVPLYVRGPGIPAGSKVDDLAGNIDLAPTIASMTGTPVPSYVDGESLLPRLTGQTSRIDRNFLLLSRGNIPLETKALAPYEEVPERGVPSAKRSRLADFIGVVSRNWKYVDYTRSDKAELYDLAQDPYELDNLLGGDRTAQSLTGHEQGVLRLMRAALRKLRTCAAETCGR